jgi:peptidoglycan/LPS O-acetylase OafA/YrhL
MTSKNNQIEVIIGLRGLAAMMVVLFHFVVKTVDFVHDPAVIGVFGKGDLGVQIFFVISGIVIPFSLIKAAYSYDKLGTFLWKRCLRIEPPYLVAVLMAFAYVYVRQWLPGTTPSDYKPGAWDLVMHVGYLVPFIEGARWLNEVFWTLAIEFQYYILIALSMPLILKPHWYFRWAFFALFAVSSYLPWGDRQLLFWSPLFLCGILLALKYQDRMLLREYILATALCLILVWHKMGFDHFMAAFFTLSVIWMIPTFRSKVTDFFGSISYSLYLVHTLTGGAVVNVLSHKVSGAGAKIAVVLVGVSVAVGCAYLFYRWIERPAQKWSQRVAYK